MSSNSATKEWRTSGAKIREAFLKISRIDANYVMIVDADDLVSNKIPEFICNNMAEYGYIIKSGYVWEYGSWIAVKKFDSFNCGTNAILNTSKISLPQLNTRNEIKKCIGLTAGHTIIERKMAELGMPLEPLPFFAAVQVTHNEQHSGAVGMKPRLAALRRHVKSVKTLTYFGKARRAEFGMPN